MGGESDKFLEMYGNNLVAIHMVRIIAPTAKGWYPAAKSLNAFRRNENKRLSTAWAKNKEIRIFDFATFSTHTQSDIIYNSGISTPWYQHENIWEFYKAIGYDYKRKRYTNDSN